MLELHFGCCDGAEGETSSAAQESGRESAVALQLLPPGTIAAAAERPLPGDSCLLLCPATVPCLLCRGQPETCTTSAMSAMLPPLVQAPKRPLRIGTKTHIKPGALWRAHCSEAPLIWEAAQAPNTYCIPEVCRSPSGWHAGPVRARVVRPAAEARARQLQDGVAAFVDEAGLEFHCAFGKHQVRHRDDRGAAA